MDSSSKVMFSSALINTSNPAPISKAAFLCIADRSVEEEVQKVRLKNIHLANALKKLEGTIRWAWSSIVAVISELP